MKTVYFDVDTQLDFMLPAGALYVPGAERIISTIAKLNRHAAARGDIVISTVDAHLENDEEFHRWPPHCIKGTLGQQKPSESLVNKKVIVPWREQMTDITGAQQILLEKRVLDAFRNPNLPGILDLLQADRYVLYGVVTEICVSCAANGLLKLGMPVTLVTDAIMALKQSDAEAMLSGFTSRGGTLSTSLEIGVA